MSAYFWTGTLLSPVILVATLALFYQKSYGFNEDKRWSRPAPWFSFDQKSAAIGVATVVAFGGIVGWFPYLIVAGLWLGFTVLRAFCCRVLFPLFSKVFG